MSKDRLRLRGTLTVVAIGPSDFTGTISGLDFWISVPPGLRAAFDKVSRGDNVTILAGAKERARKDAPEWTLLQLWDEVPTEAAGALEAAETPKATGAHKSMPCFMVSDQKLTRFDSINKAARVIGGHAYQVKKWIADGQDPAGNAWGMMSPTGD